MSFVKEYLNIYIYGNFYFIDFGRWYFCLDIIDSHLTFCFDTLSLMSSILVLVLACLALYFGSEYMFREAFLNRLLYLLNMFSVSVVFLFISYDFFLIIISWECIGLFSFLLVNFYLTRVYTVKAALKTFVFSRISDLFMFFSFILIIFFFNTSDLSFIFMQIPFFNFHYIYFSSFGFHFLSVLSLSISLTGLIKSAQFLFHVWLPDAMEAPTPASALIHSSTLVVAGIFLILRFSILFEFTLLINYFLAIWGALTLSFASIIAIFQNDIKKLVAYSTISQIGYLVCGCGFCCYEETFLYLIIHALNKAFLFILVGYLVHFFNHNTDMRQMGGSFMYSFEISVFLLGLGINLSGLPYSAGFFSKEFLLFQLFRDNFISYLVRSCWLISFLCTPIYMFSLIFIVNFGPKKSVLGSYKIFWEASNFTFLNFGLNKIKVETINLKSQFYAITSKTTSLILFSFWLFFFFWGEQFLLVLFNYSSLNETINSSFFNVFKIHIFFNLLSYSFRLNSYIVFCVLISFYLAMSFLVNLLIKNRSKFFSDYNFFINILIIIILLF